MLGDVRERLLKRGEQVLGHLVGDRVDWSLEPQFRREAERLARRIDLGEDVDPQPSSAWCLQREDGAADLANGVVEVRRGMSDAFVDVVSRARRQHGLEVQTRRKQTLNDLVVEVSGDSLSIFQHRELLNALQEPRVVDRDARSRRERDRKVLILCTEFLGTLFLAEVEIPEDRVADANGDAEERSHARMVRGKTVRLGVRREIAQAKRLRIDDEESKDPVSLGEIPDGRIGLGVDADGDELTEAPVSADDAERPVSSPNEFAR
jgi:hypothetical protein